MNVLIMGRRGLGKSTLADFVAQTLNDDEIVFDANAQYKRADFITSDPEKLTGELDRRSRQNEDGKYIIAYVPQGDIEMAWNRFAFTLWGKSLTPQYGNYSLIIDEAHRLQKPQYVNEWLDRFMRQAPRRERSDPNPIDVIQCFHRPTDVHGIVASLADTVYIFRTTKKRDLDYLEKEYESEVRDAVTTLRTPPDGRDVLRVNVEENSFIILDDEREWFTDIRNKKPEASGIFPNLAKRYGGE